MAEEPNGGGYRITTAILWTEIQAQSRSIADLKQSVALMDERMNAILTDSMERGKRLEKLETRLNGIAIGVGTGVFVAAVAFLRGVIV